jgi:hypothetical protein
VFTRVRLHHLAETRLALPTRAVLVAFTLALPQARFQHPAAEGLDAQVHLVEFRKLLLRQRRPEARVLGSTERQRSCSQFGVGTSIGRATA